MIYIAGPFFNDEERKYLNEMINYVREAFPREKLFIPMEHFIEGGDSMPNNVWANLVYKMDIEALEKCSLVCALYLGHYSDTGTAFEIGYAVAKRISVLTYIPKELQDKDMSLMITSSTISTNWNSVQLTQK
jgi:nucleoside 2-deoxyribosyltransferase